MGRATSALPLGLACITALLPSLGCSNIVQNEPVVQTTPEDPGSGSLYGLSTDQQKPILVNLDPRTGSVTKVAELPSGYWVGYGSADTAIDARRHRYYVVGSGVQPNQSHLLTIDYQSGAIVANGTIANSIGALGVDEATGKLYCNASTDVAVDTISIDEIDPTTGKLTQVASYPQPTSGGGAGSMTFDGTNKYYSVVPVTDQANVPTTLRVLDVHTGAIDSLAVAAVEIGNIEFDSSRTSFATSIAGGVRLVSIDPTSGAPTTKATFANLDHALATAASYDAQTHRYFFVGGASFPQGGSAWTSGNQIFTVDAETGHTLASPTVASTQTILNLRYAP